MTDLAIPTSGLSIASLTGGFSEALQIVVLCLTIVLLLYRVRNARRGKGE
ncbi:hypothetical protein [Azospirillum thiophilum]|nr:hypothetical protein [Azospirillum thiophilum]